MTESVQPRRGDSVLDLVALMDRLRSPGGCPWDAEQTHESLVEYMVEEAYEAVEAIESGDDVALQEELGDVLLQVVYHARLAEEHDEPWDIDDVARGITNKLISRHPHVFGAVAGATIVDVEGNWAALKAAEKGRESVTDGIPSALPALVLAAKLMSRSKSVDVEIVPSRALDVADAAVAQVGYGDLLLAIVAKSRLEGIDAEAELRAAIRGYRARIRAAEGVTS
jgi:XTP/dITP diphosphohydrolase